METMIEVIDDSAVGSHHTLYRDAANEVLSSIRAYESRSGYGWQNVLAVAERRAPNLFESYWRLQNIADAGFDVMEAAEHSWVVDDYVKNLARWKESVRKLLEFHRSSLSGVKVIQENWLMF